MTSVLTQDIQGEVLTITLNRPEVRNSLDPELLCRLVDALDAFEADAQLRVAILTGAGTQAFCAGGDLGKTLPLFTGDRQPEDEWDRRALDDPRVRTIAPLREQPLSKPVIAAVNGVCMAAGAEMLLGTDVRIAASHAKFAWPEARHALIPFAGSLARLPRQISYAQAMELLLTGDTIDAEQALRLGIVNHVAPAEQLMPRAKQIAQRIAANGPLAVREIKRVIAQSSGLPLEEAFGLEDDGYRKVVASEDAREGPRAFMQKRAPVFHGK